MKVPQFLYVPRTNTLGTTKLIVETRKDIYWQVLDFADLQERNDWFNQNRVKIEDSELVAINMNKKYPIILLCLGAKTEIKADELVKLGNMACDWYVQFYLRNKKLSKPMYKNIEDLDEKAKEYFKHWIWGDNIISNGQWLYLINLEFGLSIKFNYADALFASFEDFESEIADVQFLNGERPDDETVEQLLVDAWNFLGICEQIDDNEYADINEDIFL